VPQLAGDDLARRAIDIALCGAGSTYAWGLVARDLLIALTRIAGARIVIAPDAVLVHQIATGAQLALAPVAIGLSWRE
jgi:hypothetical protein